jgi:hypothetical protein
MILNTTKWFMCVHLEQINQNIQPNTPNGCEECLQTGSRWLHLRLCLTCGHVGCCDSSPPISMEQSISKQVAILL